MTQAEVRARKGARQIKNPELKAAADEAPHLRLYLDELPEDVEEPDYVLEPSRKNTKPGPKNLIYPVPGGLFTHILNDDEDARDYYVAIDPSYLEDLAIVLDHLEKALLDYVDELEATENDDEKREVLIKAAEDNLKIGTGIPRGQKRIAGEFEVTKDQMEAVKYTVVRDKLGLGVLDPLIHDPFIEDISCSGIGNLFIEHKVYGALKASIVFNTTEELDTFVLRLSERIKKPVTFRNPISDATLPDGSRINIVYGNDISTRGSNFTIRKFTAVPLSIIDIIDSGGISYEMAAYLSLIVQEGMNYFVSGETASGKTTLLNALTCFYEASAKIVSIEDTPELQVPHPNWTREVVRGSMSGAGGGDSGVGMFALLKAALRQRPNAIIVGEIRGEEGAIAFQAMQTGHACAATFHASSVEKLIQRLTGIPISVPKTYVDNLNVVCIASAVRLPNGRPGRRILSISELIGYDSQTESFSFMEVYHWNSHNDTFEATGQMNSYLMEHHVGPKRGYAPGDKRGIYEEIYKRARLFERLHKAGRNNFYDLYKAFAQAQRQGAIWKTAPVKRDEDGKEIKEDTFGPASIFKREPIDFDLVSQLTHMSATATSGVTRAKLFEDMANTDYSTSKYFRRVHRVAQRLNYDYSKACEVVSDQAPIESVQNLLLHMGTALSAGEPEAEFLARETEVQLDLYGKKYDRDMESLRKWTDAYVALMVSTTLIIVISLVSMMIYPLGSMAIVGLSFIVMATTAAGGWIIFVVAPHEVKTHRLKRRSIEQQKMEKLGPILICTAGPLMAGLWFILGLGVALIAGGLLLSPLSYLVWLDDKKVDRRDGDLAAFLRSLGSVMGAIGTTVTEGLSRLNRRSLGALEPHVRRLYVRLQNDISADLVWARFAGETGSELVTRCARVFYEGIRTGGDAKLVGNQAAAFALKVSQMRQTRSMIANTFAFVVLPMHAALVCILLFVTEVIRVFGNKISDVQGANLDSETVRQAGVSGAISFAPPDMGFITILVYVMILLLTAVNSFAPYAATGGHKYNLFRYGVMMMIISGVAMIAVPAMVQHLFQTVAAAPTSAGPGAPGIPITPGH